jgi:hypothetical protein
MLLGLFDVRVVVKLTGWLSAAFRDTNVYRSGLMLPGVMLFIFFYSL